MSEEIGPGIKALMTFLRNQEDKRVWLLTRLGVLIGTLEHPPEHPRDVLKLRNVTIRDLDKEEESVEELSLLVSEIVIWDEGIPDLFLKGR